MTQKSTGRAKGTGTIYKDHDKFYLKLRRDGKVTTQLLRNADDKPCTTRQQAEVAAERLNKPTLDLDSREQFLEAKAELMNLKTQATTSIKELWDLYSKTQEARTKSADLLKRNRRHWMLFADWTEAQGIESPIDLTIGNAEDYMATLPQSNRVYNDTLMTLRKICSVAMQKGAMISNPFDNFKKLPIEQIARQEFTEEQVQKIFDCFQTGFWYEMNGKKLKDGTQKKIRMEYKPMYKNEMEVLLKLCCYSGCDGESACLMKWNNVNLSANKIEYIRAKTRKKTGGRIITLPIHPILREALEKALTWRVDDYILPNVAQRYKSGNWGIQKDVMKMIRIALGLKTTGELDEESKRLMPPCQYSLHSFRHTFVSFCANAGVPVEVVASIVGHGNPSMTRHYEHISLAAKSKAMEALPMINSGAEQKEVVATTAKEALQNIVDSLDEEAAARLLKIIKSLK